jgi:hypothetical protein
MVNISKLSKQFLEGIPFSAFKKKKAYTKKKSKQKKNTRRKKKRTLKRTKRIPPNGVIIRKKNKLYRSDGKKLSLLNY